MTAHRIRAYIYLLIVAVIWGVASSVIKFTLGGIEPLPFLVYRFFLAGVLAFVLLLVDKTNTKRALKSFPAVVLFGLLAYTIGLLSLFFGLDMTDVLAATLISTVGPVVGATMGVLFLRERITKREKLGISIAFLGAVFVIVVPRLNGGVSFGSFLGNLLILGYVVGDRLATVYAKKALRKKVNSLTLINISMIVAFVTLTPVALTQYSAGEILGAVGGLSMAHHAGVWFMAFISGTVAYSLWVRGMKSIEVSEAGLFTYLSPIFATPLAVFWLGESITPHFIMGAIIIAVGVTIAELKNNS